MLEKPPAVAAAVGVRCRKVIPTTKRCIGHFQAWCRHEIVRRVLTDVANELRDRGALDDEECVVDAMFLMAKGGGAEVGTPKRGKGMKIRRLLIANYRIGKHA